MKKAMLAALFVTTAAMADGTEVYFSPRGGATDAIVREVGAAQHEIRVMTYQLTSKPIADALMAAKARGVDVQVIVDRSQSRPENPPACCANKVAAALPIVVDAKHQIHHNKVIVIDGSTVITGSFNFSNAAEKGNAENMLILHDSALAQKYLANWQLHAAHSDKF